MTYKGKIFTRNCQICRKMRATGRHHKLSQTKLNRKLYSEFIDHPDNLLFLCNGCHDNIKPKWTEKEFCEHFGIEPRSKSGGGNAVQY